jgi:16S rRNA (uracil1498-N3)-methyltransferase
MNLLLFEDNEINANNSIVVCDERAAHIIHTLKAQPGQSIRAGQINGAIGSALITDINADSVSLNWYPQMNPPSKIDCTVILALPRPKMMGRVLQTLASMGVKNIHLINTWKVEKSYWKSPRLSTGAIEKDLLLGLSQAVDTQLPQVRLHHLFRPFAEDILPQLCFNQNSFIAHPYQSKKCPIDIGQPSTIAIGPEGGFTDFEVNLLAEAGMSAVNFGARILRVETAIPVILSRLYPA